MIIITEVYSGPLPTPKFFGTIINSITKTFILDELRDSGYSDSYHPPQVTMQVYCSGNRKRLISKLF